MEKKRVIRFKEKSDNRGKLVSIESNENCPFKIKRVFYMFDTTNYPRGKHAHKKSKELMICLSGHVQVVLTDRKRNTDEYLLDNPRIGLYIEPNVWRVMKNFSLDCRLMVLSNTKYDESDYIRHEEEYFI